MAWGETLTTANWPKESGEYKVVQLDLDGQPYLRFPEKSYYTHAVILMALLSEQDIEYKKIKDNLDSDVPALEGERYKVHGMGRARVGVGQRRASFFGVSDGYGLGIDKTHLDAIRELQPDWTIEV